jgi:hypothetical protein
MDGRSVAIHQPNYIPWPGYFHKISACDVFVYLDAVQYPRGRSFAARNRIKTANGVRFLTIPVSVPKGHSGKASYLEVEFADDPWQERHLKTLEQSYRRAEWFDEVFPLYARELEQHARLIDLNLALIEDFCSYLSITTPRLRLSQLVPSFGTKTELVIDICHAVGATVYLAGGGASRTYLDEGLLNENGIELRFDEFTTPVYPQLWGTFEPQLSIIDMLFNCGIESRTLVVAGLPAAE